MLPLSLPLPLKTRVVLLGRALAASIGLVLSRCSHCSFKKLELLRFCRVDAAVAERGGDGAVVDGVDVLHYRIGRRSKPLPAVMIMGV